MTRRPMTDQVQMSIIVVVLHLPNMAVPLGATTKEWGLSAMATESLSFILIYGLVFSIFIKGLGQMCC